MNEPEYIITPLAFANEEVLYMVVNMPPGATTGVLANVELAELIEEGAEETDSLAVQIAFVGEKEVVVTGFPVGGYEELVDRLDVPAGGSYNLPVQGLIENGTPLLHLQGTLRSAEHLYAVITEYFDALEEGEGIPTRLANMRVLANTVTKESLMDRPNSQPSGNMQA